MDKIGGAFESFTGSGGNTNQGQGQSNNQGQQQSSGGGGFLGGLGDKLNSAAGGGKEGEKNEDYLDKVSFWRVLADADGDTDSLTGRRLRSGEVHGTG